MDKNITLNLDESLSERDFATLTMLYYPLIHQHAYILYHKIYYLSRENVITLKEGELADFCDYTTQELRDYRKVLERYLLLQTYISKDKNNMIWMLQKPMRADLFMKHELFGRMIVSKLSKPILKQINQTMINQVNVSEYEEISEPMEHIIDDDWNDEYEATFSDLVCALPTTKHELFHKFDYEQFFGGTAFDQVWPKKNQTKKMLESIGNIAMVYGVSPKAMRVLVSRCINKDGELDLEQLKQKAIHSRAQYNHEETNRYLWPPVRFYQSLYGKKNVPIPKYDQETIRILLEEYRLPIDVCNVLIEYVLEKNDMKFNRNFVEMIAANWVRLKINDFQQAKNLVYGNIKTTHQKEEEVVDQFSEAEKQKMVEEYKKIWGIKDGEN